MAPPCILVTRAPGQGSELAGQLRSLGAEPVLVPAIEFAPPTSSAALDTAVAALESFAWLLFTSANAVAAFAACLGRFPRASAVPLPERSAGAEGRRPRVAAIGPATARALERIGYPADLIPPQAVAESLTAALLPYARQPDGSATRFLLIRAEEARELLPETLVAAGAEVTVVPAYRTIIPETSILMIRDLFKSQAGELQPSFRDAETVRDIGITRDVGDLRGMGTRDAETIDAVTFTSASTARNLLALCEAAGVRLPEAALRISIGPVTSRTLTELGLPPHGEAREATVAALASATMDVLRQTGRFPRGAA